MRRFLAFAFVASAFVPMALGVASPPASASNDPWWGKEWGPQQIGAERAWSVSTGAGVTIGVVDTGVMANHEDLAGKVVGTTNCVGSGGDVSRCHDQSGDDNGHGTHVSGIAAASANNGVGIAGVAPAARLLVAKALGSDGSGGSDDVSAGIKWVVDHGARVVNLSLGGNFVVTNVAGSSLGDAIEYAWNHGAVPVLASGNTQVLGLGSSNYGGLDAVVVGATGYDGQVASYSSPLGDAKWGIVAPGGSNDGTNEHDIVSTWNNGGYAWAAGTSMATPHVSGAIALLLSKGYDNNGAVQQLLASTDPISCGGGCHGRLNAAKAVGASAPAPAPSSPPPSSSPSSPPSASPAPSTSPSPSPSPSPAPAPSPSAPAPAPSPPPGHAAAPVPLPPPPAATAPPVIPPPPPPPPTSTPTTAPPPGPASPSASATSPVTPTTTTTVASSTTTSSSVPTGQVRIFSERRPPGSAASGAAGTLGAGGLIAGGAIGRRAKRVSRRRPTAP